MSNPSPQWQWDATRNSYYYYNQAQNAYIYQNGGIIRAGVPSQANFQDPATSRTSSSNIYHATNAVQQQQTTGFDASPDRPTSSTSSAQYDLSNAFQSLNVTGSSSHNTNPQSNAFQQTENTGQSYEDGVPTHTFNTMQFEPATEVIDPEVLTETQNRVRTRGRIRGTTWETETLDPGYKSRKEGKKFFLVGKVFRVLWPENAGYSHDNITVVSDTRFPNEKIATKIRWFVVVKEGDDFCTCLPILTYGWQGVSKANTYKWKHAIAYTGSKEPSPITAEQPAVNEYGMMPSIRVNPRQKQEKLHAMSRINFSKMYTVEHNVKVYDFGDVHPDFIQRLKSQWRYILHGEGNQRPATIQEESESDDLESEPDFDDQSSEEEHERGDNETVKGIEIRPLSLPIDKGSYSGEDISAHASLSGAEKEVDEQTTTHASNTKLYEDLNSGISTDTSSKEASDPRKDYGKMLQQENVQSEIGQQQNNEMMKKDIMKKAESLHPKELPQPDLLGQSVRDAKWPLLPGPSVIPMPNMQASQFHDSGVDVGSIHSRFSRKLADLGASVDGRTKAQHYTVAMQSIHLSDGQDSPPNSNFEWSDDEKEDDSGMTEMTEPDREGAESDGFDDSDSSVADSLSTTDELLFSASQSNRLVNPATWLSNLRGMESKVLTASTVPKFLSDGTDTLQDLEVEQCVQILTCCLENVELMERAKYSDGAINAVVIDTERIAVASLVSVKKAQIIEAINVIECGYTDKLVSILQGWGLRTAAGISTETGDGKRFRSLATLSAQFLDFAVVSYSGAHLERFDDLLQVRIADTGVLLHSSLVLRRRSLKCLDTYLHGRQVWAFEENSLLSTGSSHDALYLSTTIKELNCIWGPVWVTCKENPAPIDAGCSSKSPASPQNTPEVLRFNLGLGFVVPWERSPNEPLPSVDEIFCHYTADETDLHYCSPFPLSMEATCTKLLIGGFSKLVTNKRCAMTADSCTHHLREQNCLTQPGSMKSHKFRDSQTFTFGLNHLGLQATYQEQYKIREGASFRESLTASWINGASETPPCTLLHKVGVEVSGCTKNSRRRSLRRILASATMRSCLDLACLNWSSDCKESYFEALSSRNKHAYERSYLEHENWRTEWSNAIASSLQILLKTGPQKNDRLSALWCPNSREVYLAHLNQPRWAGILADTIDSCAFVVLTKDCLSFRKRVDWAGWCNAIPHRDSIPRGLHHTTLETALVINEAGVRPKHLQIENGNWNIAKLSPYDKFELGDSGCLKVVRPFDRRRGIMMRWVPPIFARELRDTIREKIWTDERSRYHWEEVRFGKWDRNPITVHLISYSN